VAVLGETMVLLEATVVNVALPVIGRDLHADAAGLQWTLDGYVLTLAALVIANTSTVIAFGLLSFSQVPVLVALGTTVAPGTFLALLFAAIGASAARSAHA